MNTCSDLQNDHARPLTATRWCAKGVGRYDRDGPDAVFSNNSNGQPLLREHKTRSASFFRCERTFDFRKNFDVAARTVQRVLGNRRKTRVSSSGPGSPQSSTLYTFHLSWIFFFEFFEFSLYACVKTSRRRWQNRNFSQVFGRFFEIFKFL